MRSRPGFSARGVAERYFKAMLNGDANAAYECLDIVASPYTALDEFSDFWEDRYTPVDLYNYSVQSARQLCLGEYAPLHGLRKFREPGRPAG